MLLSFEGIQKLYEMHKKGEKLPEEWENASMDYLKRLELRILKKEDDLQQEKKLMNNAVKMREVILHGTLSRQRNRPDEKEA